MCGGKQTMSHIVNECPLTKYPTVDELHRRTQMASQVQHMLNKIMYVPS